MIPKIIHYCWFGGNPLPPEVLKYIESWKKYCPEYEIKQWNESNFNVECNQYVKEAFEAKKYAFVSDYARLQVLYDQGGIYLDTDVEILQSLDRFLMHEAFAGFEEYAKLATCVIGSTKEHPWLKKLLNSYTNRTFVLENGQYDETTNVLSITNLTESHYDIKLNNTYQELKDGLAFYPSNYFCPIHWESGRGKVTSETFTIHHYLGSWLSEEEKQKIKQRQQNVLYQIRQSLKDIVIKLLSEERFYKLRNRM